MKQTLKIVFASALITAAALKAVPAFAETANSRQNVSVVHTADLDLSSANGRRQLDRRLANAAREVCGRASDVDPVGKSQVRACRAEILGKARRDVEQLAGMPPQLVVASAH